MNQRAIPIAVVQLACLVAIAVMGAMANSVEPVDDQRVWVVLAVAVVIVSGVVNGAWIIGARRAIGRRRRALLDRLDADLAVAPVVAEAVAERLVAVVGLPLVHLSSCPLVAGKPVADAAAPDGPACGWCRS